MFCYQCEQAASGRGCSKVGVCGKSPDASDLMDLLVEVAAGVSCYAALLGNDVETDMEAGRYVVQAPFTTVTNVNFAPDSLNAWVDRGEALRRRLTARYAELPEAAGAALPAAATFALTESPEARLAQAQEFGIEVRKQRLGEDKAGVMYMILYGLKGAAAYADHAYRLGKESAAIYHRFHTLLAFAVSESRDMDALLAAALEVGDLNLQVMALLDDANTSTYGHPVPTTVRVTPVQGKAVLVSGHDLKDLHDLLEQTAGKGINVYTHGEMLPTHAYPQLGKYPHLVGNYGGAWQLQQKEFAEFPGAILLTTNCLMPPMPDYADRLFTTGLVSYPGIRHVDNGDFGPVVAAALAAPGFPADEPEKRITVGFGHKTLLGAAAQVVAAVKAGEIKHFFLIGGCDGAKPGRNYYTEFAEATPRDTVILTLACGKYRFNKLDLGEVAGLPRILDVGQCNDAYSAVRIAVALAEAFDTTVNDLPLSFILSWYEQKAVAILLTLLHLGIKNIHLGPTLPAFATPAVLQVLVEKFAIRPTGKVADDLARALSA